MDRNFYSDDFEQLLKEKADQFRMYPSKRVWHSIYNNLHPSRRWPSAAMSMLLIISLLLTGYLNTSDNSITNQFVKSSDTENINSSQSTQKTGTQKTVFTNTKHQQLPNTGADYVAKAFTTTESELLTYTDVKTPDPNTIDATIQNNQKEEQFAVENKTANSDKDVFQTAENTGKGITQVIDTYIKTNQIFVDIANANNKTKIKISTPAANNTKEEEFTGADENDLNKTGNEKASTKKSLASPANSVVSNKPVAVNENSVVKKDINLNAKSLSPEEKAWIDNYALQNKSRSNKWKDKLDFEFYITPAVNYRKLTTDSKGSATPFATTGDINKFISQKPGLGVETGVGLSYAFAKNLKLKTGIQFNYTNYNINADQTNHPVLTTLLLNDPTTGYSYLASRTSTISNAYNSSALQPIQIHNRTYQISIPVGLSYKLSSTNNVEWFAGASVQPTYIFGGNAHLISSDLKSYVSDPSSISNWNLNLGFETYMNYKLGGYRLQVGPQVRYQVYSTYRKNVALIEKPYAVGLKVGIIKGF
ncbi:MAG: outer membrane beta-barrel protein [Ferruginibacter sp.]